MPAPILPQQIGIYYVVRLPKKWSIVSCRFEGELQFDHGYFWKSSVCPLLGRSWAKPRNLTPVELEQRLQEHIYGFPRGRVACSNGLYHVYHGSDLPRARGMGRCIIERTFRMRGRVKWVEDDHERSLFADKEAVRHLLALDDDWPAA